MSVSPVILVTGGYDHKIRFWDATSGVCSRTINFGESQVNCLQISNDKTLLAAGGNPSLQLYDINSIDERPLLTYEGHSNNITSLGFQHDQRWIYSSSEDGSVRIWDPRSNTVTRKYDCGGSANTVALHPNESMLISGDQNGYVKLWDLKADKCREEYLPGLDVPIRSTSMAIDGSFVSVGSHRGKVFVYNMNDKYELELSREFQAHEDYLLKCLVSNDLKLIATASADKTIKLWNTTSWEAELVLAKHQRWVWDVVFSADSCYLLSASSDQTAKLWDLRSGDVVRNYQAQNNTLALTCVALNDITLQ